MKPKAKANPPISDRITHNKRIIRIHEARKRMKRILKPMYRYDVSIYHTGTSVLTKGPPTDEGQMGRSVIFVISSLPGNSGRT